MMKKRLHLSKKSAAEAQPDSTVERQEKRGRVSFWQALFLPVVAVLVFLLLLEGGLMLFGVKPSLTKEDPFVGFAANVPLFVPDSGPDGEPRMVTAQNKLSYFNRQSFLREKASDAFRVFALGGSTTYGRPYDDLTSFPGWLRELLPVADPSKRWEVINAGGIGFASYRVAHLMEELISYQPDLFIVYTGHNEFLEERTYREIKEIPTAIRFLASLLSRTRTWSAMEFALEKTGLVAQAASHGQAKLGERVDAILDKSAGLERYTRDDSLHRKIANHYRVSLERMVALARSANAEIVFVTPASNLKDCSPFKSQHVQSIDANRQQRLEKNLLQARKLMVERNWPQAVRLLEQAAAEDPRHAEIQYRLGKVYLELERFEEARTGLRRARDEDVCPLRAPTALIRIVEEVAREQGVPLVDYISLLEQHMMNKAGHSIPGQELFLDHVHPTIEGHRLLAIALIETLATHNLVALAAGWGEETIQAVTAKVEEKIDQTTHGQALANLARVLLWAGKSQDAARLARQARSKAAGNRQVLVDAASILTSIYSDAGKLDNARQLMYATLQDAPGAIEIHLKLGRLLGHPQYQKFEEAAAHLLLVCQQMPRYDTAYADFALAMVKRGRLSIAYNSLTEALALNPSNAKARAMLTRLGPTLQENNVQAVPFRIELEVYPSGAPRKLVQMSRNAEGRLVGHGIEVEFFKNGRVKRFVDLAIGKKHGMEKIWDRQGRLTSQASYQHGEIVEDSRVISNAG